MESPQPVEETITSGPEVDIFATILDVCLERSTSPVDKRNQVLRLVEEFHDYVEERWRDCKRRKHGQECSASLLAEVDMDQDEAELTQTRPVTDAECGHWEQETQTWDLLRRILPLRYPSPVKAELSSRANSEALSVRNLWDDFLDARPHALEWRAVLQWLQQNAASNSLDVNELVRELQENADRGDIIAHGWLHTRSAIKLRKTVVNLEGPLNRKSQAVKDMHLNSSNDPLVTELDPDAITRQSRKLEPQDEYFERAIWLGCFEHLRRGSTLETIRDWCAERAELWRAVSVSVVPLTISDNDRLAGDFNPESLTLWRRICFSVCRKGGCDDYERGVYGILAGDISSVEKVCKSWDDFMFANYNALLRTQFDTWLMKTRMSPASVATCQSIHAPDTLMFHGDAVDIEKRLVKTIEADVQTGHDALQPLKALQAAIISRDLDRYLYDQGLVVSMQANARGPSRLFPSVTAVSGDIKTQKYVGMGDHMGLRVMAHVLFIFSMLDTLGHDQPVPGSGVDRPGRHAQEHILTAYVSFLRLAGLEELIPLYCSGMKGPRVWETLSINLIHLTDDKRRTTLLRLMRKYGLNSTLFVTAQTQQLLEHAEEASSQSKQDFKIMEAGPASLIHGRPMKVHFLGEDPGRLERQDENLIRSVEWQLLDDGAWPGMFRLGTRVYKYFLGVGHLNAARSFFRRVPFADIIRRRISDIDVDYDPLWEDDLEYWQGLEDAGAQPSTDASAAVKLALEARTLRELESLVQVLDSLETISSLVKLTKEDLMARRDVRNKLSGSLKVLKEAIRPLKTKWLLSGVQDDNVELMKLRDTFLPETIIAYITVLQFAGANLGRDHLLEAMEVAAVIAEDNSDLASCFTKANRIRELVETFASCSKALAVASGEARGMPSGTKKLREMGWTKDLWSV